MTDGQLLKAASGFRKGLLKNHSSESMCFVVTYPLQGYLSFLGFKTALIEGEIDCGDHIVGHFWLRLPDGRICDPTADQFSIPERAMPPVYIGEKPNWYEETVR